jgi:hypothetical protein
MIVSIIPCYFAALAVTNRHRYYFIPILVVDINKMSLDGLSTVLHFNSCGSVGFNDLSKIVSIDLVIESLHVFGRHQVPGKIGSSLRNLLTSTLILLGQCRACN